MDYIYPIVKLHNIGEKIGGNIDFFFSEIMFRRTYKKPSICCLAFIWIHFKQSITNKKFCFVSSFFFVFESAVFGLLFL